ncbi:sensor histidine kinase [Agromyces sp. LHK192]|uniref:sensor histidine kinase n=1 Tax=Agromyces sp. LHK192 TaxID=2498704 RepID=UPI000FD77ADF|nr:histidine kinase [Agromyces sp. LHK192]
MKRIRWRLTDVLAPAVGVVYLVLWWVGEAGRLGNGSGGVLVSLLPLLLFSLAIMVSQVWPAVSLALIGGTLVLQVLVEGARFSDTSWPAYLPLLYAVFNASAFGRRAVHWITLPVAALFAVAVSLLLTLPSLGQYGWPVFYALDNTNFFALPGVDSGPADLPAGTEVVWWFTTICLVAEGLVVGAWSAGLAMRAVRQAGAAKRQAQALERGLVLAEAETTALSERERLAREVHDVMAHSLAVIAAQADGARMLDSSLSDGSTLTLATIADAARDGLIELRRLLDHEPQSAGAVQPTIADLDELVDRVRGAGLSCTLTGLGDPRPLGHSGTLGVYRIVQEALTNAVRHARADGQAMVTLDWRGPGLALLIATPTSTPFDAAAARPGRGIRGMQERARIAGGWLTAGPDEDGTFLVNAFIPVDEPAAVEVGA